LVLVFGGYQGGRTVEGSAVSPPWVFRCRELQTTDELLRLSSEAAPTNDFQLSRYIVILCFVISHYVTVKYDHDSTL
jgi:hypothetical protein